MKIVARTPNPLSSQGESTQMLCGKISRSKWHSTEWRFERRSCNPP